MTDVRILAGGLGFPEGPVALADGSVVLTEINGGWVTRVGADGTVTRLGKPAGGPNGLAMAPEGDLILCNNGGSRYIPGHFAGQGPSDDYVHGSIERVDPATGARELLFKSAGDHKLSAPNDIVFDRQGGCWFTDLGKRYAHHRDHGGLYYVAPGAAEVRVVAYPFLAPNGVGLSPDERTVYVAETETGRLWAFDVESPGVIRKAAGSAPHGGRLLGSLPGYARFDSLGVLASGNIAVATLGIGTITVFGPDGLVRYVEKMPCTYPTNICFGGADMRTAWVTLSGTGELAVMRWPEAGLRLNNQQI
jgi:gluconolactonase